MSKRDLKKYLGELDKEQLLEQLIELYEKFSVVKEYYDFVFNRLGGSGEITHGSLEKFRYALDWRDRKISAQGGGSI